MQAQGYIRTQAYILRQVLSLAALAAARKATMPVTQHVLFEPGRVRATNLEVYMCVDFPDNRDATFIAPLASLLQLLERVPGHQLLDIILADGRIQVEMNGGEISLAQPAQANEFPPLPDLHDPVEASADGDRLVEALAGVLPFAATEETRPILTGICVQLGDDTAVVAADGFRLAWQALPAPLPGAPGRTNLIIPRPGVEVLRQAWRQAPSKAPEPAAPTDPFWAISPRPLELRYDAKTVAFTFGEVTLYSQLLTGQFPSYAQLIPSAWQHTLTLDPAALFRLVKLVEPVARRGSNIVRLQWEGQQLRVSSRAEEDDMSITLSMRLYQPVANPGRIAFNARYVLECLKGREGVLEFQVNTPSTPGLFAHRGARLRMLLMPMFVRWGDEPEDEQKGDDPAAGAEPQEAPPEDQPPGEEEPQEPEPVTARRKRGGNRRVRRPSAPDSEADNPVTEASCGCRVAADGTVVERCGSEYCSIPEDEESQEEDE